ncbi:MAG: porin [Burkholderiaceae bacterium]|nr:MAG: porin [Burkholderiaceae bacterium]
MYISPKGILMERKWKWSRAASLCLMAGALFPMAASADDWDISGFGTLGAGKALSGVKGSYMGYECPCYIANYPDVGLYRSSWSASPDTRGGVQGTYHLNKDLSATAQATINAANGGKAAIDWAYGSYNVNGEWTIQAGRKRLPLFGYSDFFQVGYAYPWIRPPGDLYGWQIVAYNGANAMYRHTIGDVSITTNVWMGTETDTNNQMLGKVYYGEKVKERWKGILGGYVEAGFDWGSIRAVVMENKVDRWLGEGGTYRNNKDGVKQQFYGLTVNIDKNDWVLRTEFNRFVRPDPRDVYSVYFVGAGYRFGDFLPMLTYSSFKENFPSDTSANENHRTVSASLRWDFRPNTALKVQYDIFKDRSAFPFVGNSKALAVSLDYVF